PGFGEVLPGMHGGIGAQVALRPIRGRPIAIVLVERGGIIRMIVIAEDGAALVLAPSLNELIPIVVADLVSKMPNQCAMRFAKIDAKLLSLDVVGFTNVDRNAAGGMAGVNLLLFADRSPEVVLRDRIGLEVERQRRVDAVGRFAV